MMKLIKQVLRLVEKDKNSENPYSVRRKRQS